MNSSHHINVGQCICVYEEKEKILPRTTSADEAASGIEWAVPCVSCYSWTVLLNGLPCRFFLHKIRHVVTLVAAFSFATTILLLSKRWFIPISKHTNLFGSSSTRAGSPFLSLTVFPADTKQKLVTLPEYKFHENKKLQFTPHISKSDHQISEKFFTKG